MSGRLTHVTVRALDWLAAHVLRQSASPPHQRTGRRGEDAAYFHLRRQGYVMVARHFRSPHHRGEIDLIGWDKDVLCFVEVKTRTSRGVKPAEAAVDQEKRSDLAPVIREYLRRFPRPPQWRFDVVSVYYQRSSGEARLEVFRNVPLVVK